MRSRPGARRGFAGSSKCAKRVVASCDAGILRRAPGRSRRHPRRRSGHAGRVRPVSADADRPRHPQAGCGFPLNFTRSLWRTSGIRIERLCASDRQCASCWRHVTCSTPSFSPAPSSCSRSWRLMRAFAPASDLSEQSAMAEPILGLVVAICLGAYLVHTLLRPEHY